MTCVVGYGDRAALIELADAADVLTTRAAVLAAPGVLSVVPAARTVLIEYDPALTNLARLTELARSATAAISRPETPLFLEDSVDSGREMRNWQGERLVIPVRYDGPDLAGVAEAAGLTIEQVIRSHCDAEYTVQFCGFSPGFGYLTGLPERLRLPRLASPRPVVPAGAVAIADGFTGIYPRPSPGGWRLIGRTELDLFDLDRDPPALLRPGLPVWFVQQ